MRPLLFVPLALALACRREGAPSEDSKRPALPASSAAESRASEHEGLPHRIKLSDAVFKDAGVKLAPAVREALSETLTLTGEVGADPDHLARISSPAAGRIEQVFLREGRKVKKGDALLVVRVPEIGRVRSTLSATESRASAARANAERLHELFAKQLASEQEALNAKAEADALASDAKSLKEQLGALGAAASGAFSVVLRAPIAGTVIARDAVVGQPVSPEQTLGSIAALDELWFLGRVFEKDLGRMNLGANSEVCLNAYPTELFAGTVEYIGEQVDPTARAVTARIRLQNREGLLRIGLFGTAAVALRGGSEQPARLVVPRAAVTDIAGKSVVFVREPSGEFELHEVTLGRAAPGRVEVLAGLGAGEMVVTEGVFTLKSVVLKGSFAEEDSE